MRKRLAGVYSSKLNDLVFFMLRKDDTPKREVLNLLVWARPALILTEDEDGGAAAQGASLENSR